MKERCGLRTVGLLVLMALLLIACSPISNKDNRTGSSNANAVNGGFSIINDDWLYFMNSSDNGYLYRVKTDGSEETKLLDKSVLGLNLYQDKLFFCGSGEDSFIYKINPDGQDLTQISSHKASNLLIVDDWLYYIDTTIQSEEAETHSLHRMKADGSEDLMISDLDLSSFNVVGDWIYFLASPDSSLYKVKTDGQDRSQVSDMLMSSFCISDDQIYFTLAEGNGNKLWKMNLDGSDSEQLGDDNVITFNANSDYIYYGCAGESMLEVELKRMKPDGSESAVINEDDAYMINVHGDWLVYISIDISNGSMKQTLMKTDGSGRRDYEMSQSASPEQAVFYQMGESVLESGIRTEVITAYASNLLRNPDPEFNSPIFDEIASGTYLFINLTVTNESSETIDLADKLGIYEDRGDEGTVVYGLSFTEINETINLEDPTYRESREAYKDTLLIGANETKKLQINADLGTYASPFLLGIFESGSYEPLALIEIRPVEGLFVTSWEGALEIMRDHFPNREITQHGGIGFIPSGEQTEKMFYTFELEDAEINETKFFLVERDSGMIYEGVYDPEYPDYMAIPVKPIE